MNEIKITSDSVSKLCDALRFILEKNDVVPRSIIGIPRGGLVAAYALAPHLHGEMPVVALGEDLTADAFPALLLDDVCATGETFARARKQIHPISDFVTAALICKPGATEQVSYFVMEVEGWVTFPWEASDENSGPEDAVRRIIEFAGYDPSSPALKDTPRRVLAFYEEMRKLREQEFNLTAFEIAYQDLVVVKDIPIFALCEHHLLPFFGKAHVGYIPCATTVDERDVLNRSLKGEPSAYEDVGRIDERKVLGLSKVARIVQQKSSGLATQERLSHEIAEEVERAASTDTVAVVIEAEHTCMKIRGPRVDGAQTITSAMFGRFRDDATLRMELLSLLKS